MTYATDLAAVAHYAEIVALLLFAQFTGSYVVYVFWSRVIYRRAVDQRNEYQQQQAANGRPIEEWMNPPEFLGLNPEQRMQIAVANFLLWAA
jgi:hypothetical protein